MFYVLVLYLLPAIITTVLFKNFFIAINHVVDDAYYGYAIICYVPVVNLLALLLYIISYVCEILRKN